MTEEVSYYGKSLVYYFNNDYSRPITVIFYKQDYVCVHSEYWESDFGEFDESTNTIKFNRLGSGIISNNSIDFRNGNVWHNDRRGNLLFIGANDMSYDLRGYVYNYKNGLFIEAIPDTYRRLQHNLTICNKYNAKYMPVNKLVTDENNKEYSFKIFDNNGASSSIYEPNQDIWQWDYVKVVDRITLVSTRVENILNEYKWDTRKYDVVLDVQGAELLVLKGFGSQLRNIQQLTIEISTKEFYKGGVLFDDLNAFLVTNHFIIENQPEFNHCDVVYRRIPEG